MDESEAKIPSRIVMNMRGRPTPGGCFNYSSAEREHLYDQLKKQICEMTVLKSRMLSAFADFKSQMNELMEKIDDIDHIHDLIIDEDMNEEI